MGGKTRSSRIRGSFELLERRDLLTASALSAANVLVLYNTASLPGTQIANYYAQVHPGVQLLGISGVDPNNEYISADAYLSTIRPQVVAALTPAIDVIVTTKGLPLRICVTETAPKLLSTYLDPSGVSHLITSWHSMSSLESELTDVDTVSTWMMMGDQSFIIPSQFSANPYYLANSPFSYATYHTRLTSRLDGYSVSDVTASIDRAQHAYVGPNNSPNGPFYFLVDNDPTKNYAPTMASLVSNVLNPAGLPVVYDDTTAFVGTAPGPVIGYVSHGTNQASTPANYILSGLNITPANGAVFETWESYNAYTFDPTSTQHSNQGKVAQWLQIGGTAGVGNVDEPGASSSTVTNEDQMFKMLLAGYTFAEAAWSATTQLSYVNTVVGDPLMTWSRLPVARLFYDQSIYDNGIAGVNVGDDQAIATDKVAYVPGSGQSTFANISSYSSGINGLMIDLGGSHPLITANDFAFQVGTSDAPPSSWPVAPSPKTVTVRAGAGDSGADRVELIWDSGAILNTWLEVTVRANANTGLTSPYTFFFGNLPGDTGLGETSDWAYTDATDQYAILSNGQTGLTFTEPLNVAIANPYDVNRDGNVDASDQYIAKVFSRFPHGDLGAINVPVSGYGSAGAAVASVLASSAVGTNGLSSKASDSAGFAQDQESKNPPATLVFPRFPTLADSSLPGADAIAKSEEAGESLQLDDEMLDALISGLTMDRSWGIPKSGN